MRTAFVETLLELAATDERIFLLTADLGWGVLERFAATYPDRFLNVGVAEQNMAGVVTGLAQVGYVPFIYSIATFTSMRCYEQVRNGPVLHQMPVRVVGIGGGYAYGHAGPTHHALEDLVIARAQPGLTVIAPADPDQARSAIAATMKLPGPVYYRIGKGNNMAVPGLDGRFALGSPEVIRPGRDLLFLCTGTITHEALQAAQQLQRSGISAAVAVQAHLGFSASPALCNLLAKFRFVVTVEEGYVAGGLGSLAAETIAQEGMDCRLSIQGIRSPCSGYSGGAPYMYGQCDLNAQALVARTHDLLRRRMAA